MWWGHCHGNAAVGASPVWGHCPGDGGRSLSTPGCCPPRSFPVVLCVSVTGQSIPQKIRECRYRAGGDKGHHRCHQGWHCCHVPPHPLCHARPRRGAAAGPVEAQAVPEGPAAAGPPVVLAQGAGPGPGDTPPVPQPHRLPAGTGTVPARAGTGGDGGIPSPRKAGDRDGDSGIPSWDGDKDGDSGVPSPDGWVWGAHWGALPMGAPRMKPTSRTS